MFFRGAGIQRDEHGRCDLLPKRRLSSNRADLSTSDGVVSFRLPHWFQPRAITSQLRAGLNQPDLLRSKDWLEVTSNDHLTACSTTEQGSISQGDTQSLAKKDSRSSRERVAYVRSILGNRRRSFGNGRDVVPLRGHHVLTVEQDA
jgi:hypothetical protein